MKLVTLPLEQVLFRQGESLKLVYFPTTAIVSLLNVMDDARKVEVATVGPEGMLGVPIYLGRVKSFSAALVQREGKAYVIPTRAFLNAMSEHTRLRKIVETYSHTLLAQAFQSAGCNAIHTVEQRLVRWLLAMADRAQSDTFPLRQELMAAMLSVLRQTVGLVASDLQRRGLIAYRRGKMTIVNRPKLEVVSCECYGKFRDATAARRTNKKKEQAS